MEKGKEEKLIQYFQSVTPEQFLKEIVGGGHPTEDELTMIKRVSNQTGLSER